MKHALILLCLAHIVLSIDQAFGQTQPLPAQFGPHFWTATVKVIGEDGGPIVGADVSVQYSVPTTPESDQPTFREINGLTDTSGMFTTSHSDSSLDLGATAKKAGFYSAHIGYQFYFDEKRRHPSFTLVLKKVGNPIAMYAKHVENGPPAFNEPVGYDLIVGDWVAPYGKGLTTDIIFTGKLNKKSKNDFDYKLTVSFPNVGDGIQEFSRPDVEKGSSLRSPHEAPADGYQTEVVRAMSRHPGQASIEDLDLNRNYFFRVRTVLDSNGNVKSALHGKIYGDFMEFSYYLNPTSNDRNVEFDTGQNLMGGLQSYERVKQP